ncbi:phosphotransferase family protein [Paenibacillus beijingensis]|uniref:phosphotransferase family protein n=1 Tax=Paenibacillus beijingensis TaxID=1126833 RepID=UPI0006990809|nr:phosphotransferase [Paenibacillus beijingensis]
MDHKWERSIPLFPVAEATAAHLLRQLDPKLKIERMVPLTEGKRNTNYRIDTSFPGRTFLLRIFPPGDESWRKETGLRAALRETVPMQQLYWLSKDEWIENRTYAIYGYAEGKSLLESMMDGFVPDAKLMDEIGRILAAIHRKRYDRQGFLDEKLEVVEELPPLSTWYGFFLSDNSRARLGEHISAEVEKAVRANSDMLREIDQRFTLIHGDFRPTNLLVHEGKASSVLDWEFAHAGHPIADIGQWFRYDGQFTRQQQDILIRAYNESAEWKLPDDWARMGKMRDLINLLQMIGPDEDMPEKFKDLKRLIDRTLRTLNR